MCSTLDSVPTVLDLIGKNTYVEVSDGLLPEMARAASVAIAQGGRGTRLTMVVSLDQVDSLLGEVFERVECATTYGGQDELAPLGLAAVWAGRRMGPTRESKLDHRVVSFAMDVRDTDGVVVDKTAKDELTWTPISHDASLWRGKGMPADVEKIMTEGVSIEMNADAACFEVPQYPYRSEELV